MSDSLPGDSSLPPGVTDRMIDEALARPYGQECQRCGGEILPSGTCRECGEDGDPDPLRADDVSDAYDDFMDRSY